MIDGQHFFDQPVRNDLITYGSIRKTTGKGDDYTTGCLLDYNYFKKYHKMIVIDFSSNSKHLMLIQNQGNNLILPEI